MSDAQTVTGSVAGISLATTTNTNPNPVQGGVGTAGFNTQGTATQAGTAENLARHDEVRGEHSEEAAQHIRTLEVGDTSVPESPFVRYVKRPGSSGLSPPEQTYYPKRMIGQPMIRQMYVRNGHFVNAPNEADLFTMDLPAGTSENTFTMDEILHQDTPQHRDI